MKKICFYLSAFIPLYALLIIKILINIVFGNLHFNILNSLSLALYALSIIFGLVGVKLALTQAKSAKTNIFITKKESLTEQYFLGYFSIFVLFALSFEIELVSMFVVFWLIIIMIGVVYVKNNMFYINPFLNLLGFNFYEITYKQSNSNTETIAKVIFKGELILDDKPHKMINLYQPNFSLIEK